MADADDVRRLAVALPGVEEIDSDGFDFRVGGKGFVWSYPERRPGKPRVSRTDIAVLYVDDEAVKQALLPGGRGCRAGQLCRGELARGGDHTIAARRDLDLVQAGRARGRSDLPGCHGHAAPQPEHP